MAPLFLSKTMVLVSADSEEPVSLELVVVELEVEVPLEAVSLLEALEEDDEVGFVTPVQLARINASVLRGMICFLVMFSFPFLSGFILRIIRALLK